MFLRSTSAVKPMTCVWLGHAWTCFCPTSCLSTSYNDIHCSGLQSSTKKQVLHAVNCHAFESALYAVSAHVLKGGLHAYLLTRSRAEGEGSEGGLQNKKPQRLAEWPCMSRKRSRLYAGSASYLYQHSNQQHFQCSTNDRSSHM